MSILRKYLIFVVISFSAIWIICGSFFYFNIEQKSLK